MSGTSHLRREFDALRRKGRLPQRGKKAARDRAELDGATEIIRARSGGACEADGLSPYCTGVGTMAHHVKRRSQGGSNDPSNLRWVDAFCHQWIHDHPAESYDRGLLRKSWEDE